VKTYDRNIDGFVVLLVTIVPNVKQEVLFGSGNSGVGLVIRDGSAFQVGYSMKTIIHSVSKSTL
jgi:hypothetical protein